MTAIQTAFENHVHSKADLRKRADGTYQMKSTRAAYSQFRAIYEIGFADGRCEPIGGRRPMGKEALQQLADQAQAMGMGYGD